MMESGDSQKMLPSEQEVQQLARATVCGERVKVGIFGGSFDPPTIAHLQIAAEVLNLQEMEQIWVIPCGKRVDKNLQVEPYHRLEMCRRALEEFFPEDFPIFINDIEVKNGSSIPTYPLLRELSVKYPMFEFSFILGTDLLPTVFKWENGASLLKEFNFIVYQRHGYQIDFSLPQDYPLPDRYTVLNPQHAIISKLSSTEVRSRIKGIKQLRQKKKIQEQVVVNGEPGFPGKVVNSKVITHCHHFKHKASNYLNVSGLITKQVLQYILIHDLF